MNYSRIARAVIFGAAICLSAGSVQAAPLFDFNLSTAALLDPNPASNTYGYTFRIDADTTVDGLGFFDFGGDGIGTGSAHRVTLWDSSMVALESEIINNGTSTDRAEDSASGLGRYIYMDIEERVLEPGSYTLGASFNGGSTDPLIAQSFMMTEIVVSGAADFGNGVFGFSSGTDAVFPDMDFGLDLDYFGPTLRVQAAVPEPLTAALLLAGIVGFGLRRGFPGQSARIPSAT
jgi:hypothetical protein